MKNVKRMYTITTVGISSMPRFLQIKHLKHILMVIPMLIHVNWSLLKWIAFSVFCRLFFIMTSTQKYCDRLQKKGKEKIQEEGSVAADEHTTINP